MDRLVDVGPQGAWRCAEGHSGYIVPVDCQIILDEVSGLDYGAGEKKGEDMGQVQKLVVRRVQSNVKGGVNMDLSGSTLITGPNEGGKSAVTDSIMLALAGRVSDMAGKDEVALAGELMALAPGREGILWSKVWIGLPTTELGDCKVVEFRTEGGQGRAKRPTRAIPEALAAHINDQTCMPLRELQALFSSSSVARRRAFFFQRVCQQLSEREVKAQIPHNLQKHYQALAAETGIENPFSADALIQLRGLANVRKNETTGKLKEAETALTVLAGSIESPPLDSDLTKAKEAAAALTLVSQSIGNTMPQEYLSNANQVEQELANTVQKMNGLQAQGTALGERRAKTMDFSERMKGLAYVARIQAEELQKGNLHSCALCSQSVDVQKALAFAQEVGQIAEAQSAGWTDADEANLKSMRVEYNRLRSTHAAHANRPAGLRSQAAAVQAALTQAGVTSTAEVSSKLAYLQTEVNKMETATNNYARVRRARDQKGTLSEKVDLDKRMVAMIDEAMATLLAAGVVNFEKAVSRYLPDGDAFRLLLWEGVGKKRSETCLVGLDKTDEAGEVVLHTALSGAAWARVTTAVACLLAESQTLAVIIPQERAYMPETLRATMSALSKAPAQVIITHPTKHKGGKVAGWSHVEVG
jgi:hypothetical protein